MHRNFNELYTVAVLAMASMERAQASTLVQSRKLSCLLVYTEDELSGGTALDPHRSR